MKFHECQSECKFQEKPETYVGMDDKKRRLVLKIDKKFVTTIWKVR
jgi:hypothetical protein